MAPPTDPGATSADQDLTQLQVLGVPDGLPRLPSHLRPAPLFVTAKVRLRLERPEKEQSVAKRAPGVGSLGKGWGRFQAP